jgi:SAM-dependent methyltransferase
MENFRTNKKYDLIFDICGPLCYSRFKSRIFEQYLRFLRPGGKVVCEMHLTTFNRLPFSLGHAQTSNRPHYFETKTEGRLLVLTKKRNPHYKRKTRKKSAIAIIK